MGHRKLVWWKVMDLALTEAIFSLPNVPQGLPAFISSPFGTGHLIQSREIIAMHIN